MPLGNSFMQHTGTKKLIRTLETELLLLLLGTGTELQVQSKLSLPASVDVQIYTGTFSINGLGYVIKKISEESFNGQSESDSWDLIEDD